MSDEESLGRRYSADRLLKVLNTTANEILCTNKLMRLKNIIHDICLRNQQSKLLCLFLAKKTGRIISEIDIMFSEEIRSLVISDFTHLLSNDLLIDEELEATLGYSGYSTICYGSSLSYNAYICLILISEKEGARYNNDAVFRALAPYVHTSFNNIHFHDQYSREFKLSIRERDVIHWMAKGKTNKEIATILAISQFTVKNHIANIYAKLNVVNRAQAIDQAIRLSYLKI